MWFAVVGGLLATALVAGGVVLAVRSGTTETPGDPQPGITQAGGTKVLPLPP